VPNSTTSGTGAGVGRDGQTADTIRINNASNNNDRGTRYEVIRTGTGSIEVAAGRDLLLRNPFATIYTAGVGLVDRTAVLTSGDFVLPVTTPRTHPNQGGTLGAAQQNYEAYYAMAGGDLRLAAGRDIGRFARHQDGNIVADASMQLPSLGLPPLVWVLSRITPPRPHGGWITATSSKASALLAAAISGWRQPAI
jgi:filamentous hemagglutinin